MSFVDVKESVSDCRYDVRCVCLICADILFSSGVPCFSAALSCLLGGPLLYSLMSRTARGSSSPIPTVPSDDTISLRVWPRVWPCLTTTMTEMWTSIFLMGRRTVKRHHRQGPAMRCIAMTGSGHSRMSALQRAWPIRAMVWAWPWATMTTTAIKIFTSTTTAPTCSFETTGMGRSKT